ncbi:MAG: O-antigen ligase family protein [Planctomycetaceae bacterium]
MSRSAKVRASQPVADGGPGDDILESALQALVAALIVARMLIPSESSVAGATLWITQLWLATPILWYWICYRRGAGRLRIDRLDWAVWAVIVGHCLSGWVVYQRGGQVRSALNMVWEWIGLGCALFMVRQVIFRQRERHQLLVVLLLVGATCAGLGLWQHYLWYPQIKRDYTQHRLALDQFEREETEAAQPSLERSMRIGQLRSILSEQGIPLQGPQRELWENRIRNSTEPFGPHALANTLAGLLVFWWLLLTGQILASDTRGRSSGWRIRLILLLVNLMLLTCLALTKSRTAWVGGLVAVSLWWLWQRKMSLPKEMRASLPRWAWPVGVVTVLLLGGVWLGSLDREILSEAPKSLKYRAYYWSGTLSMLADHPLVGSGPGNFRQHYLRYKLPESSEEISDPHNLFLGIWTSGGLLALCGLLLWISWVAYRVLAASRGVTESPPAEADQRSAMRESQRDSGGLVRWTDPTFWGAAAGFVLVVCSEWVVGQAVGRTLLMLFAFLLLVAGLHRWRLDAGVTVACATVALLALGIHLLGAGGIQMPAVVQMPLLLSVLALPWVTVDRTTSGWSHIAVGALGLLGFVGCLFTATLPVLSREAEMGLGDAEAARGNNLVAQEHYEAAASADVFSPRPQSRMADLSFRRSRMASDDAEPQFQQAVRWARRAIALDAFAYGGYVRLSRFFQSRFRQSKDPEDARQAQVALLAAVDRYPNNAALVAELAQNYGLLGQQQLAQTTARKALDLDQINQREGHSDKRLAAELVAKLTRLADPGRGRKNEAQPSDLN